MAKLWFKMVLLSLYMWNLKKKKMYKAIYPQNRNRVIDVTNKHMVKEGALREGG